MANDLTNRAYVLQPKRPAQEPLRGEFADALEWARKVWATATQTLSSASLFFGCS